MLLTAPCAHKSGHSMLGGAASLADMVPTMYLPGNYQVCDMSGVLASHPSMRLALTSSSSQAQQKVDEG